MNRSTLTRCCALAAVIALAVPLASAQGKGKGNGGGSGGGGGGSGGGSTTLYSPVLIVNGQRRDLEFTLSQVLAGDYVVTGTESQPQQIMPVRMVPSLTPSMRAASTLVKPSTSQSRTQACCIGASASMARSTSAATMGSTRAGAGGSSSTKLSRVSGASAARRPSLLIAVRATLRTMV